MTDKATEAEDQKIATDQTQESTEETSTEESTEETKDSQTHESTSETEETDEIDYEAELQAISAERDNYRTAYLNEKDKGGRTQSSEEETDKDEATDDDTSVNVRDIIRDERRAEHVDEIASDIATSDAERRLILHHYKNSIQQTGSSRVDVRNDLETARVLANRKRVERHSKEVTARAAAVEGQSSSGGGGGQQTSNEAEATLSDADKSLLSRFGADPKDVRTD